VVHLGIARRQRDGLVVVFQGPLQKPGVFIIGDELEGTAVARLLAQGGATRSVRFARSPSVFAVSMARVAFSISLSC
jgi:hypothetical protein